MRKFRDIAMVGRPLLILSTMALVLWAVTTIQAAEFGTREEAKAMLDKAVAAVKENKEKALAIQQWRKRLQRS
jgi:hypothetical protein